MYDALEKNWEGYEDLRQTIINECHTTATTTTRG
jgi:hypothetical protein